MQENEQDHSEKNDPEGFMDLFGVWDAEDLREFLEATKDQEKVDPEDWDGNIR